MSSVQRVVFSMLLLSAGSYEAQGAGRAFWSVVTAPYYGARWALGYSEPAVEEPQTSVYSAQEEGGAVDEKRANAALLGRQDAIDGQSTATPSAEDCIDDTASRRRSVSFVGNETSADDDQGGPVLAAIAADNAGLDVPPSSPAVGESPSEQSITDELVRLTVEYVVCHQENLPGASDRSEHSVVVEVDYPVVPPAPAPTKLICADPSVLSPVQKAVDRIAQACVDNQKLGLQYDAASYRELIVRELIPTLLESPTMTLGVAKQKTVWLNGVTTPKVILDQCKTLAKHIAQQPLATWTSILPAPEAEATWEAVYVIASSNEPCSVTAPWVRVLVAGLAKQLQQAKNSSQTLADFKHSFESMSSLNFTQLIDVLLSQDASNALPDQRSKLRPSSLRKH